MELFSNLDTRIHTVMSSNAEGITHEIIENYVHISDRDVPPRAVAVLPSVLQFRRDCISPRRPLPSRIRFGPVKGVIKTVSDLEVKEMVQKSVDCKTPLFLIKSDTEKLSTTIHIDHTDHDKANWLGLLPLGDQTTANVWLYEQENNLYAVTTKSISSRVPLMLGYSSEYIKLHGFPPEAPCLDLQEASSCPLQEWWCYECQRAMPSAALLQYHVDSEHKEDNVLPRRRYRCQRCKRTFARLFTLKRHMARYCTSKAGMPPDTVQVTDKSIPNIESDTNSLLDESRVPSEEILQNFTSSIDFNSLFDTYRSLDLSSSSKSTDLIDPDNQLSKDDISLTNDTELNFANAPTNLDQLCKETTVCEEPVHATNNYSTICRKKTKLERIQQYVSDSPNEIFGCDCGLVFLNRDKLIRHMMEHSHSHITKTAENTDIMYKCEDCQLIFKRRGMFVNHLWRVHQNVSTVVPLERRVRQYPCAASGCPKLYRTAAKRDRHLRIHHPGVVGVRAIESGRRACEAAACVACPRQYATRAKLLQHVRAAHPHIAPPVKRNTKVHLQ